MEDPEEYVRWHQMDHTVEQFRIPGLTWGRRYFASPGCVTASVFRDSAMGAACHLQNYLLEDAGDLFEEFSTLGLALAGNGRYEFGIPRVHLQAPLPLTETRTAPHITIGPAGVAFRPSRGIFLLVEDRTDPEQASSWSVGKGALSIDRILTVPAVSGVWIYQAQEDQALVEGSEGGLNPTLQISVFYLDGDPIEASAAIAPHLEHRWAGAPVRPVLAGAFRSLYPPPARWCHNDDPDW
jgi:hypothetical protein